MHMIEKRATLPVRCGLLVPEKDGDLAIPDSHVGLQVPPPGGHLGCLERNPELLPALPECLVGPVSFGDVALDRGERPDRWPRIGEHGDCARRGEIAERARRIFHVGLELIEGVVELAVALVGQQHESLENLRMPVAARRLSHRIETVGQLAIAGQLPQIHERQQKFRIVGFEPIKIG